MEPSKAIPREGLFYRVYRRFTQPFKEKWVGGLHAGLVIKGLYLQRAIRACLQSGPKTVLDAGCGPDAQFTALLAGRYPRSRFEAWDLHINDALLESCRRRKLMNLHPVQANLQSLQKTAVYDLIYSIDVLEHIEDYESVLDRFVHALRPGGTIFIHVPSDRQRMWFEAHLSHPSDVYREHREGDDHVREGFDMMELRKALESRSIQVTNAQWTFNTLTSWLKGLFSLGERNGVRGIGILLLPFVIASVCLEMLFPPKHGNGLWILGTKIGDTRG